MSNKTKNIKNTSDKINEAAKQVGIVLMAAAATLGMLELPDHPDKRVVLPNQPVFAFANNISKTDGPGNQLIREREEVADHFISYSVVQRTPTRSGRL